jgi:hypothetical protein
MKRCHCCHGRFGLIRHYYNLHAFCRLKCVAAYQDGLRRKIAAKKNLIALNRARRAA